MKKFFILFFILGIILFTSGCVGEDGKKGVTGAKGVKGDKGDKGNDGLGSININYTFTGGVGTLANVTNVGNSTVAYLDFTIPKGDTGASGDAGDLTNYPFLNGTKTYTGNLNIGNYQITNVNTGTNGGNAVNKTYVDIGDGVWNVFTPSLTWTGATPASITAVGKYNKIGKTVNFWLFIVSNDGNGATGLTIALPYAANGSQPTNYYQPITSYEYVNAAKTDPFARILYNTATPIITFSSFTVWTDAVQSQIWVSGTYETT